MTTPTTTKRSRGKQGTLYRCAECGWTSPKWVGRCGECQAWGTVDEAGSAEKPAKTEAGPVPVPARPIADVDIDAATARPTGMTELDHVLGGGIVPGAVALLAGEPGVGKSTLLLNVASLAASAGQTVLYVSAEESPAQIRLRAERIGALRPRLLLAAETDLSTVLGHIEQSEPDLLVIDSVQTISSDQVEGSAGGVSQVREVSASIIRAAKAKDLATVLVGHVTKDGSIAGPRVLEHLVDVVCQFEGERHTRLRMVRAVKNRYGPTDEVGCFELAEDGITSLPDPSGLFLSKMNENDSVSGTCVTVTLEGRRPLVAEVQALVAECGSGSPRRATSGLDSNRVAMVLAVLAKRLQIPLAKMDVYAATVGGAKIAEPTADLATALALGSAFLDQPFDFRLVAFGEVGLSGELRPVPGCHRRLLEAARLGFTHALVPTGTFDGTPLPEGLRVLEVSHLSEALHAALPNRPS